MSGRPRAWVLNLDAEHELAAGCRYAPTRHVRRLVAQQRRRLVGTLVGPEDVVLADDPEDDPSALAERAAQCEGLAWSPTPRALARLRAAGCAVAPAPDVATLRRVNARPFAARVRAPLAQASFAKRVADDLDSVLALLARPAPLGWLVRRPFGAAGRGRRRIAAGAPTPAELSWLRAGLRQGALVVEPWVAVTREYTRSGWVGRDGTVAVSRPCFQETAPHGAWLGTTAAGRGDVGRPDDDELARAAESAGRALAAAGYSGPFGIDAFRYRLPGERERLNPLSEINARFTMDWRDGFPEPSALAGLATR